MFKHLFTPWRMSFIKEGKKQAGCVFCNIQKDKKNTAKNLMLYRGENAFIVMNKYPYNTGHIMVVPFDHGPGIEQHHQETVSEIMLLSWRMMRILDKTHQPQGFNTGMNIGKAAGAGIPDHLHFHVVPRWVGDTNFMPLTAGTRVLPETLEQTYSRLVNAMTGF